MLTIGFLLASVMGLILGLMGGGGSILTVPILVYLFKIPATSATGYSLFVVGLTSLIGAIRFSRHGLLDYKVAFLFSLPSMIGVWLSRRFILPHLPHMLSLGSLSFSKDQLIMVCFSVMVLLISFFMFHARTEDISSKKAHSFGILAIEGVGLGLITGFIGAGGGFMIVPALMFFAKLSLKTAIATSLLIIATNSLSGVAGDIVSGVYFDWPFLIRFVGCTLLGVVVGTSLNKHISPIKLRRWFAYFVMIMGLFILIKESF